MSTKYWLPCSCGEKVIVGPAQTGERIVCRCGKSLDVPVAREEVLRLEPVAEEAAQSSPAQPSGRKLVGAWGRREAFILLGTVVTVVALALVGFLYLTWPRLRPVEQLGPTQTYGLWLELQRGVNRYPSEFDRQFAKWTIIYRYWMIAAVAAAVTGLLLTLSAFIFFRPTRVRADQVRRRRVPRGPPPAS